MSDLLIFGGVVAILVGLAARYGLVSWFGNLPGDFRRVDERSVVFVPFTSMVVISVIVTILLNLLGRYFRS